MSNYLLNNDFNNIVEIFLLLLLKLIKYLFFGILFFLILFSI